MRKYEITTVYRPNVVEDSKISFRETLSKYSVKVHSEDEWGIKKLWHPVDGCDTGFFHFFQCEAEPSVVPMIEKEVRINQNILKSMVVRVDGK